MIRLDGVSFAFGAAPLLQSFNLEVAAGATVALVGASGSGKSTILRLVAGLLEPTSGRIDRPEERALVFQDPRLLPWMTVEQNVHFALRAAGVAPEQWRARTDPLLARVGLAAAAGHRPATLSGGMAQRAALVRGLALRPRVLLLDEPFSAVDPLLREDLQDALVGLLAEYGPTTLLVTHDVAEALLVADRVVVLRGRPVAVVAVIDVPGPRERGSPTLGALAQAVRAALAG